MAIKCSAASLAGCLTAAPLRSPAALCCAVLQRAMAMRRDWPNQFRSLRREMSEGQVRLAIPLTLTRTWHSLLRLKCC